MAGGWAGRYLVAGVATAGPGERAVYRIEREEGAELVLTILTGSAAVVGRTVRVATSNARANIALGHEQLWEVEPPWVGRGGLLDGAATTEGADDGDHGGESAGCADVAGGGGR